MDLNGIYNLVVEFRRAIDEAYDKGLLDKDTVFRRFPRGCCGDTCDLLAEYLRVNGVNTVYVFGNNQDQSHAWLILKDKQVRIPKKQYVDLPNDIVDVFNSYTVEFYSAPIDITHYVESDLRDGIIIDITGDQFGEIPVYFNYMNDFYGKYEFKGAYDFECLQDARLLRLYRLIVEQIA